MDSRARSIYLRYRVDITGIGIGRYHQKRLDIDMIEIEYTVQYEG